MRRLLGGVAAITLAFAAAIPAAAPAVCTGDCDGSTAVTVDEVVVGLSMALGTLPVAECVAFDADSSSSVTVDEIVSAVSNALDGCPPEAPAPVFPANYRDTYTEVRDCRFSIEHGGVTIRVLANDVGRQPYLDDANPLPVGSIIVKEEFAGSRCDDEDFVRWRAMRKESPGFDPDFGDWHWQWVEPDRTVTFDDKSTCIGCHIRPECLERDYQCTVPGEADTKLEPVLEELPAALLSISGTGPTDMYAVGADPEDGFGPLVLRYDGSAWRRLNTHATGDLWWISVIPIDGAFYMVGSGGLVLRYDLATRTFEKIATPGTETLFGVWGTSSSDLWVVGGNPDNPESGGALWHYNGSAWSVYDSTRIRPAGIPNLFKVWGRSATEIYAVGNRGIFLRYNGESWTELNTGSVRPLFTVHGNDTLTVASGGFIDGVMIEFDGETFAQRAQPGVVQMNGVFIPPNGDGVAVGITGGVSRRDENGWEVTEDGLDTLFDFHGTFVDSEGGTWAVGGDLSVALEDGMLAYAGSRHIGSQVIELPKCPPGEPNPNATVSYTNDVLPIFVREGCLSPVCHGGGIPAGGYDMRTYETSFGQGTISRVLGLCDIVPGNPDTSFLIEKLGPSPRFGNQMPDKLPPLDAEDVQLLRTWILEGASDDRPATPTPTFTTLVPTRTPTRGQTQTPGVPTATPTALPTLNPLCNQAGRICTMAGTGAAQFDGDGRDARATSFYYPIDLQFDGEGRLLILDWNNLRLRRLEPNGTISTIMGKDLEAFPVNGALAKDTALHHASDIEFDQAGNMYIAGDHVPVVFRVNTNDRVFTIAGTEDFGYDGDGGSALSAKLQTPFGVLPKPGGGFYIADVDAHVVRFVDAGGTIDTVAGTGERGYSGDNGPGKAARLAGPSRMVLDSGRNLYICETKNHVIRRLAPNGIITTAFGTGERGYEGDGGPATAAQFDAPYGITIAPNGDFYIADTGNNVVRRVNAAGVISTVVGLGVGGFGGDNGPARDALLNRPSAIAFDDSGAMWIADTYNQRVRRVAGFLGLQQ